MARNLAALIDSIKLIYTIQPSYYITWSMIKQLILSEIGSMFTEKGAIGVARAKQIEKFCIRLLFRHLSSMLNKRHFTLLLFVHSFNEYSSQSATTKPSSDIDLLELLHQSLLFNEQQKMHASNQNILANQPDFMSLNSWINCSKLENKAPAIYSQLTKSIADNSVKWIEYFHLNSGSKCQSTIDLTEKEIDLLNDCPFERELDIVEKLIVWLCVHPEKVISYIAKVLSISTYFYVHNL